MELLESIFCGRVFEAGEVPHRLRSEASGPMLTPLGARYSSHSGDSSVGYTSLRHPMFGVERALPGRGGARGRAVQPILWGRNDLEPVAANSCRVQDVFYKTVHIVSERGRFLK